MPELENTDVIQEVVNPAEEEIVSEPVEPEEPKKGSAEFNFRELRTIVEDQKKLLSEQQSRIRELEYNSVQEPVANTEDDDLSGLSEDDFLTVKQAKKLAHLKAEEIIKKREIETLEDRVRLKYKDYDEVVSEDNVLKLIEDDQELADTLRHSPNPYTAAYKLIKKSSFFKQQEDGEKYKAETKNLQKNLQKPVSANSVQSKPLAKANAYANMDRAERESLFREMSEYASRRN